jgi:hypothetical protein
MLHFPIAACSLICSEKYQVISMTSFIEVIGML